jgi:integrase
MERSELERTLQRRLAANSTIRTTDRLEQAKTAQRLWREAGIVKVDAVRTAFIHTMQALSHPEATCPKSWRHSFATLLQDARVDPLIRQITLGHAPTSSGGALGMTSVYTHTRPETQRAEIFRALRLWPQTLHLAQTWAHGGA